MNYHNNMKPTTEQILSALNKLVRENKTELKAEKVELGDIDDLKKLVDNSKKILKEATTLEKKIQSEKKSLFQSVDAYNKLAKNLDEFEKQKAPLQSKVRRLMEGIKKASKELGVNANSLDGMQEAFDIDDKLSRRSQFGMEADLMFVG